MPVERRLDALEERQAQHHLILTGDLRTVGLIESVRGVTTLVGEMKKKQEAIAEDIAAIKELEAQRLALRRGEEKATRRLLTLMGIAISAIGIGSGSLAAYAIQFLQALAQ